MMDSGMMDGAAKRVIAEHLASHRLVRRNEPCPCGSGKKFKQCHLKLKPPGQRLYIQRRPT